MSAHSFRIPGPRAFAAWLRVLFRHDWVVYAQRPFGRPEHVLLYLGAYAHRVAISNTRLVALSEDNVTFSWRDSAPGNKKRLMTLPVEEFLRPPLPLAPVAARFQLDTWPTAGGQLRQPDRQRATTRVPTVLAG